METVSENDALDDLTSAIELNDGLGRNCDTHLLWFTDNPQKHPERRDVIRLLNEDPKLQDELRILFDIVRPDIVHTHRMENLATVGQAARRAGVPNIVHSVCNKISSAEKWQRDDYAAVMERLSPLLIAPSEEAAGRLPRWAEVEVIPAGIDCERYAPGDQARERRKIGLPGEPRMIGCASPLHGFGALLHALFRMDREVHMALFGQARPGQEERGLIKRLGLEERVHVLGGWAKPELVFRAIDVYFQGPSDDCLPRAVLAAQACGKPVIASAPTPNNMLCPQTGRLTPIQYMPTLQHSLQRALEHTKPEVTRQFVLDNWNAELSLEGYNALFHRLANENQRKRLPA